MLKRLGLGVLKGLVIGGAIGAAFHFGLGWTVAAGLLGYLIAMGAGATAGILSGRPPWKQEAWIESILKAVAGLGVGALLYWVATKWGDFTLPFALPGVAGAHGWTELPLLTSTGVGMVFGTLIELDNTGDGDAETPKHEKKKKKKQGAAAKPVKASLIEDAEVLAEKPGSQSRTR